MFCRVFCVLLLTCLPGACCPADAVFQELATSLGQLSKLKTAGGECDDAKADAYGNVAKLADNVLKANTNTIADLRKQLTESESQLKKLKELKGPDRDWSFPLSILSLAVAVLALLSAPVITLFLFRRYGLLKS